MDQKQFFDWHAAHQENRLRHRRVKHAEIEPILKGLSLEKECIGHSFEGRAIYKVKVGSGPVRVLLWSQMHGDEATATLAIFDLFRFFEQCESPLLHNILHRLSLHFVPMLNPDGAERFTRRTAQLIDMNRDALALACPESRLLKKLQDEIAPHFSFNLHDQDVRYAAGQSPNQTAIAFLATAFNEKLDWNPNRIRAMQIICMLNDFLQGVIPNRVGRWFDDFEPRAFGDNIQKWGSSLILVESGGKGADREKQELRKLNFCLLLKAFGHIANNDFGHRKLEEYERIPINNKCLFDLKIRNAKLYGQPVDIGINLSETGNASGYSFTLDSLVEDIGDLSGFYGIEEFEAKGLEIEPLSQFLEILSPKMREGLSVYQLEFEKKANFALVKNKILKYLVWNGQIIEAKDIVK